MKLHTYPGLKIRQEKAPDQRAVNELIKLSFNNENPALLVNILKEREGFVKELSLVAELHGNLIGYVLLSPLYIQAEHSYIKTLWLEPVCVHPQSQGKGIGTILIKNGLEKGRSSGFESVFVTGDVKYYSRFGFRPAHQFGISSSVYIPLEAFLAMELKPNALLGKGKLIYPEEIFE